MPEIALSLGSNIGDKRAHIAKAVALLEARGLAVIARSSDYRSEPWGPVAQDWFVNACLLARTDLSPQDLLALCLSVEREMGRTREIRWGPRVIDIDVLAYDDRVVAEPELKLPHPHMLERAFVLVPLAEIAPELRIGDRSVAQALAQIEAEGIVRLDPAGDAP